MRLTEILGMEVVSASGRHLGRVVDLRSSGEAERGESHTARVITEIIFGQVGWLERMGLRPVREQIVPWAEVDTIGTSRITLQND
ncbi:MAG: PRC-barrel domain-containing protein [Bacteroidota bacterium]